MTWQEPLVYVIVGLALVSLFRHLRAVTNGGDSDATTSCHGCDDCDAEVVTQPTEIPIPPTHPQTH